MSFHPNFPAGKGLWIWKIPDCEGGDVQKIINKLKTYGFSYVFIKAGDGDTTWSQFNKPLVDQFHANNIKIYSWTYNYGTNPLREADIALWALDMGVDGHIFDAEGEFERLSDPSNAAKMMLLKVREKYPNAFLGFAPFPIISYHQKFPYVEFGRYCDAVMPQMYWGTLAITPDQMIARTYEEFTKWENLCRSQGNPDAIKPIIPVGQAYDNPSTKFVLTPTDLKSFIAGVSGYMSVNFWSFQHLTRTDCWEAIRDSEVKSFQMTENAQNSTNNQQDNMSGNNPTIVPTEPTQNSTENTVSEPNSTSSIPTVPVSNPESSVPATPTDGTSEPKTAGEVPETVTPNKNLQTTQIPANIEVPTDGKTTITMRPDPNSPQGVNVQVQYHKTHLDYLLQVLSYIKHIFKK